MLVCMEVGKPGTEAGGGYLPPWCCAWFTGHCAWSWVTQLRMDAGSSLVWVRQTALASGFLLLGWALPASSRNPDPSLTLWPNPVHRLHVGHASS